MYRSGGRPELTFSRRAGSTTSAENRVLRRLRPEEFDAAHSILVSAADWLISRAIRQWTTAYPKDAYQACQEKGWNYGLICNNELAVVMTLSCELPAEWADCLGATPVWWLSKIATAPDYRGFGLGAVAVGHAIDALSAEGADSLYLDCVQGTGFLVDFYRSLGFRAINRRNVRFATGLFDMVLMERTLARTQ
jgi:GNAT superfamily N-acetyltransferase